MPSCELEILYQAASCTGRNAGRIRCSGGHVNGVYDTYGLVAEMAKFQGGEEVRLQAALEYLGQMPCVERPNGRRQKVLPREVAQLVLLDLADGHSHSAIVRRYERVCKFSRAWPGWPR